MLRNSHGAPFGDAALTRSLPISLVLLLLLAACAGTEQTGSPPGTQRESQEQSETTGGGDATEADAPGGDDQPVEPVVLRAAHIFEPEHPFHACGWETIQSELAAQPELGLEMQLFPAGQLGSLSESVEAAMAGNLEMTLSGGGELAPMFPPVGVLEAGYVFDDPEHMLRVNNGPIGDELWGDFRDEFGLRVLTHWLLGVRHVTANKPIRSPEDMQGLSLRTPPAPVTLENAEGMGANPTPIDFGELYLALSQGVVDAQENTIPTIASLKVQEVQDYLNLTGHVVQGAQVFIADTIWETLSTEQQEALQAAADKSSERVSECVAEQTDEFLATWAETGELETIDDVDVEAFRTAVEAQLRGSELWDVWGELYERIRAEADA